MTINQELILTEDECMLLIDEWRVRLSLEDWKIYLSYLPSDSKIVVGEPQKGYSTRGGANINFYSKDLVLFIYNPTDEDRLENPLAKWDMEYTIVHELTHVHFAHAAQAYNGPDSYDEKSIVLLEQSVDAVAKALIAAKRGFIDE